MLLPPDNFGLVDEGIYRCSKLDAINFAFLETLKLKTIAILDNEAPVMKNFENFMKLNGIKAVKFENQTINTEITENSTDWMVFTPEIIQKVFKVLLNKNNYNLLVIDKTNVVIALLRKVCKWNYSGLISEYRLYSGKNSNYFSETFLEIATIQLTINNESRRKLTSDAIDVQKPLNDQVRRYSEDAMDVDEEENEENLLSASPKVPKALLRMVELRKKNKKNTEASEKSAVQDLHGYTFYDAESALEEVGVIKVELPPESALPDWFRLQRDMWEASL